MDNLLEFENFKIMKNKALFLDMDNTIIMPKSGNKFPKDINDWKFIDGVLDIIKTYQETHYLIIVTNQGGIASGYVTEDEVNEKIQTIINEAQKLGVYFDEYYYAKTNYLNDMLRKPNPGMALKAINKYKSISLEQSTMVGDMDTDKQFRAYSKIGIYYDINDFLKLGKDI